MSANPRSLNGDATAESGPSNASSPGGWADGVVAALLVHVPAASLALLTILLAGQPIYANDTWIHLALGEAFAAQGPWLAADPHLYAAPGPPSPSSWLGSVALFGAWSGLGFTGLRILHAAWVALILGLAWLCVRRASTSSRAASAALVLFIALSTYRLVQLRPDLFSIAATFAIALLLVLPRSVPGPKTVAASALIAAIWANVHAAFLLGPLLILGVGASLWLLPCLPGVSGQPEDRERARRLAIAGALMLLATLANPQGLSAHLAYLQSGEETLALRAVADEWGPTNLLAWPLPNLPPTWAAWVVSWVCVVIVVWGGIRMLGELRRGLRPEERSVDPALWALAVAGMIAALLASRFLWLEIFALAVGGALLFRGRRSRSLSAGQPPIRCGRTALTGVAVVLAVGLHLLVGDWVLVSRSFGADYRQPYHAGRFNGHAIWFLADSGVQGRIYNDYPLGGFMSFWLSPALQMSSSGTMNVAVEAMEANLAIGNRLSVREGESFEALLDRQGIDLFLGTGLPIEAIPGRRDPSSVHHLEAEPGWILVFRSLRGAVYLRRNPRNARNLERIADYYAAQGVPFDPQAGFDVERAIARSPDWAIDHGIVPVDFVALVASVRAASSGRSVTPEMHRLATLYATLGLYDRALAVDRRILLMSRGDFEAGRRSLWCLLRAGRLDEALRLADRLESMGVGGGPDGFRHTVEQLIAVDPEDRARLLSFLPLYPSNRAAEAQRGFVAPPARIARPDPLG